MLPRAGIAAVLTIVLVTSCGSHGGAAPTRVATPRACAAGEVPRPGRDRVYSAASPFNRPIPRNVRADRRSALMIRGLADVGRKRGFVLSLREWTIPVYVARHDDPRFVVPLTAEWSRGRSVRGAAIPPDAKPDPRDDAHLAVLDPETGCEWDFWQARRKDGRWVASWGNRISPTGRGIYRDGLSARASGFGLLAGLVFPEELRRGRIEHALVFSFPHVAAGGPVAPATASDGTSRRRDAIPEGARLQLDPRLDLDTLRLSRAERTIARALQVYGMYLGDRGGAVGLYAAHPQAYERDPYARLTKQPYLPLRIPLERMRVLELPPQRTDRG